MKGKLTTWFPGAEIQTNSTPRGVQGTGGLGDGDKNHSIRLHILWSQSLIWWIDGAVQMYIVGIWPDLKGLPISSNTLSTSWYVSKISYQMARELEIHLDPFDQESVFFSLPLVVGFVFQNKMGSFRKLFLILSGRHRKGESGRWTNILSQRKAGNWRERNAIAMWFERWVAMGTGLR